MPNLSLRRKILNAALVLLIASFVIKKWFHFLFFNEMCEYMQNLVIPIITLRINNSEGPGEPDNINNDSQGNNVVINENANDLANEGNNQEAIQPVPANPRNQLDNDYD